MNSTRAKEAFELTKTQLEKAKINLNNNQLNDSVRNIWLVFENCINIIKDIKNNRPVYDHSPKIDLFRDYHDLGILRRDYSEAYSKLNKIRLKADFGPYALAPPIPPKVKTLEYLELAYQLFEETKKILTEK